MEVQGVMWEGGEAERRAGALRLRLLWESCLRRRGPRAIACRPEQAGGWKQHVAARGKRSSGRGAGRAAAAHRVLALPEVGSGDEGAPGEEAGAAEMEVGKEGESSRRRAGHGAVQPTAGSNSATCGDGWWSNVSSVLGGFLRRRESKSTRALTAARPLWRRGLQANPDPLLSPARMIFSGSTCQMRGLDNHSLGGCVRSFAYPPNLMECRW
jgi:hypothetical protein